MWARIESDPKTPIHIYQKYIRVHVKFNNHFTHSKNEINLFAFECRFLENTVPPPQQPGRPATAIS